MIKKGVACFYSYGPVGIETQHGQDTNDVLKVKKKNNLLTNQEGRDAGYKQNALQ